jgi:hypothetical protein
MEYIKDNKKSKSPTSIRFNEAQLKIAFSKSGKKSRQQLVDWLIDRFINSENPIQEKQVDYSNNLSNANNWTQAPMIPQQPQQIRRSYDWYKQQRISCNSAEDWNELKKLILDDQYLSESQKINLTQKSVQL